MLTTSRKSLIAGETFHYENLSLFRDGSLSLEQEWTAEQNHEAEYQAVYEAVKSSTFKKTEFALSVASSKAEWVAPKYITDGLKWLESELRASNPISQEEVDG